MERPRSIPTASPVLEGTPVHRLGERPVASQATVERSAPLEYAAPVRSRPIDWAGAIRQSVFAVGCGCVFAGVVSVWASYTNDLGPLLAGGGAFLVSAAVPWPGRFGRKR